MFIFIQLQAQPLNSYILISAEIEQQSEEGAEADRLGKRRLAAEAFAVVCHFRGEVIAAEIREQAEAEAELEERRRPFSASPGENVR